MPKTQNIFFYKIKSTVWQRKKYQNWKEKHFKFAGPNSEIMRSICIKILKQIWRPSWLNNYPLHGATQNRAIKLNATQTTKGANFCRLSIQHTNLNGKSTSLVILSLNRMFLNENLLRWMIRISGSRHTDSCLVASRWALHSGQYLQVSGKTINHEHKQFPYHWNVRLTCPFYNLSKWQSCTVCFCVMVFYFSLAICQTRKKEITTSTVFGISDVHEHRFLQHYYSVCPLASISVEKINKKIETKS